MSSIPRPAIRLFTGALALAAAGGLALSGCSKTKDAAMDAGEGMGEMAKDAAGGRGMPPRRRPPERPAPPWRRP